MSDADQHHFHFWTLIVFPMYFVVPKRWLRKARHKGLNDTRIAYFVHDLFREGD